MPLDCQIKELGIVNLPTVVDIDHVLEDLLNLLTLLDGKLGREHCLHLFVAEPPVLVSVHAFEFLPQLTHVALDEVQTCHVGDDGPLHRVGLLHKLKILHDLLTEFIAYLLCRLPIDLRDYPGMDEQLGRSRAIVLADSETGCNELPALLRDIGPDVLLEGESPHRDLFEQLCFAVRIEGEFPANHLIGEHPQTPDVARGSVVLLLYDLRGDVVWCPDEIMKCVAFRVRDLCKAEIDQLYFQFACSHR